jgi:hypothetical protein
MYSLMILRFDNPAGVDDETHIPDHRSLRPIYPNPFRLSVNIGFSMFSRSPAAIDICDIRGRVIRSLAATQPTGVLTWDGTNASGRRVASGIYVVRLEAGGQVETRRVSLIR